MKKNDLKAVLINAYTLMYRARMLDEKSIILYKQNKCHFQIGASGHEAVQVAAASVFKPGTDWFYPYYRDLALCAALGMTDREFLLNFMNKAADPNSHGRQMPMHYGKPELRIVSQSSPTGTQFLQAIGCALGVKLEKKNEVVYVSAGEGTCAQGDFHEALNWASRDKLPVLFLIQNNAYAISVHISEQFGEKSIYKLVQGYEGLERYEIDGTDFLGSKNVIEICYKRALSGGGPALIEAHVPRLQSHSISDNQFKYRSSEDIAKEKFRDPITKLRTILIETHGISDSDIEKIEKEVKACIDESSNLAEKEADCDPKDYDLHIVKTPETLTEVSKWGATSSLPLNSLSLNSMQNDTHELFMVDALNKALEEELTLNPQMYIFGQDVARGKGGVFGVTAGLTEKFGQERVFNTQLAESSIVGTAIGMAVRGLKPVPEIQFGDYIWTAMMQIRNELALMHYRSGGEWNAPVVIRVPVGGYIHGGPYHSQNIEATFAHFPGIFIAYPSNARDAKGLLKTALRGTVPVLFLEHKGLYRQPHAKNVVGTSDQLIPFGKAAVKKEGDHLTIITWGAMVNKSVLAAKELDKQGKSIEIIDLLTIVPLDIDCIHRSLRKTNRILIVQEDILSMGFGAEIAAVIAERFFKYLDAPIYRVGMKNVPHVPHAPILENIVLPQVEDIVEECLKVIGY
jgi:2-oxoisovalerate dehydrogenase E1 component